MEPVPDFDFPPPNDSMASMDATIREHLAQAHWPSGEQSTVAAFVSNELEQPTRGWSAGQVRAAAGHVLRNR